MSITPSRAKWAGTMTDRERFNNQMHYKPIDRCFNMEFGYWKENYQIWDAFVENKITNEDEANIFFHFDKIATVGFNCWLQPAFEQIIVSETESTKTIQNSDGLLAEIFKDGNTTIPHYSKPSVVTPEDWKRVKEERLVIDDPNRVSDIAEILKQHPNNRDYPLGIWTGSMIGKIRDILTFEGLAYAMYDYPDMVEDMVETFCLLVEHSLDQLLPHFDFDFAAGWEDICFKNGPIVSVDFFNNVVVPRYKRIQTKLKEHGIDLWYSDCDGDVRPIMDGFLDGGINCLFPFEVMGCAHPSKLFEKYGKNLRIMGGFDKMQMVAGKPEIKAYMESLVPLVERGGYIPFCDHLCPPDVSYENYIYYLDLKENMFGM